jgi:hypothetical protein
VHAVFTGVVRASLVASAARVERKRAKRLKTSITPDTNTLTFFSLNSSTRASSGVIVAHLIPTLYFLMASAASTVTWSSVASRLVTLRS